MPDGDGDFRFVGGKSNVYLLSTGRLLGRRLEADLAKPRETMGASLKPTILKLKPIIISQSLIFALFLISKKQQMILRTKGWQLINVD